MSIVTINGSTGIRMALIQTVPSGSMNFGTCVDRRSTPAPKPATSAIATCNVGDRNFTGARLMIEARAARSPTLPPASCLLSPQ